MKNLILTSLFILISLQINAQLAEPQWQMPLYFEDATGQRDTVWLGYDPDASPYMGEIDPQFGEGWQWIDTSKFNVYFFYKYDVGPPYGVYPDTVLKKDILSWPYIIGTDLRFTHGVLPITVKWEEDMLNSPNLPAFYPDITPRPKARIDLMFHGFLGGLQEGMVDNCPVCIGCFPDVILTGYTDVLFPTCFCAISDSLVINDCIYPDDWYEMGDYFDEASSYSIVPHDFDYFGNVEEDREVGVVLYPNPVTDILNIDNNNCRDIEISIYNIQGKLMYKQKSNLSKKQIDFSGFNPGMYLTEIKSKNKIKVFKIPKFK